MAMFVTNYNTRSFPSFGGRNSKVMGFAPLSSLTGVLQMIRTDQVVLNLDCQNLHAFNPGLYENLVSYPQEIIPMFDMIAGNIRDRIFEVSPELPTNSKGRRVEVRPYHLQSIKSMRELNPEGS
jgi:DNA replication licensing factor MCM4